MKQEITFNGDKHIVIISTPVFSTSFTQVTCLMTDEELHTAKAERPDLIFRLAEELPSSGDIVPPDDETKGITVKGMTLPHNLDNLIEHLFQKE